MDVDSARHQVDDIAAALVREYLNGKGCHKTLKCMDDELCRSKTAISSRSALAKSLRIEKLLKRNKHEQKPYRTMLEVITKYFVTRAKPSTTDDGQQAFVSKDQHSCDANSREPSDIPSVVKDTARFISVTDIQRNCDGVANAKSIEEVDFSGQLRCVSPVVVEKESSRNYSSVLSSHDAGISPQLDVQISDRNVFGQVSNVEQSCRSEQSGRVTECLDVAVGCVFREGSTVKPSTNRDVVTHVGSNDGSGESTDVCAKESSVLCASKDLKSDMKQEPVTENATGVTSQSKENSCWATHRSSARSTALRNRTMGQIGPGGLKGTGKQRRPPPPSVQQSKAGSGDVENSSGVDDGATVEVLDEHVIMPDKVITVDAAIRRDLSIDRAFAARRVTAVPSGDLSVELQDAMGNKLVVNKVGSPARPVLKTTEKLPSLQGDRYADVEVNDLDDADESSSGLMVSSSPVAHVWLTLPQGNPLDFSTAMALKTLLLGGYKRDFPEEWIIQNFGLNKNSELVYGLIQKKGGPCGVLACVQAYLLKELLFSKGRCTMKKSALERAFQLTDRTVFSDEEVKRCLALALAQILWKAGNQHMATIAFPSGRQSVTENHRPGFCDGFVEKVNLLNFTDLAALQSFLSRHVSWYTGDSRYACIAFLYSAILSRGIDSVRRDMDDPKTNMIGAHSYCCQEIVNLLLTGHASSNVFDNVVLLDEGTESQSMLRGVTQRSDIGFLALFEHYNSCQVGRNLKCPRYPIWVVCSESHFTILFAKDFTSFSKSLDKELTKFDLFYYDALLQQDHEIRLTIDLTGERTPTKYYKDMVPPLELCIRTKWKDAIVDWNGTEPLL